MTDPCFKQNWERAEYSRYELSLAKAQSLIKPYTKAVITKLEFMQAGCANSNYKLSFAQKNPIILRFYIRDKDALPIEAWVKQQVHDKIPVASMLYTDDSMSEVEYPFALLEFIPGILMRDICLQGNMQAMHQTCYQAGTYLKALAQIQLPHAGFFHAGHIKAFSADELLYPYMLNLLEKCQSQQTLSIALIAKVKSLLRQHESLLVLKPPFNLSHGDFDPSNILVSKNEYGWTISAILDWEFSFSGHYYFDMGNMLRYAHRVDSSFEESFLQGLQTEGLSLPQDWKQTVKLYDLVSLLQFCATKGKQSHPNLLNDVTSLIVNTIDYFKQNH